LCRRRSSAACGAGGARQIHHSAGPAMASRAISSGRDSRSRTSLALVCATLAIMVLSITTPYCHMKWLLNAVASTSTVASGRNTRGQWKSASRARVPATSTSPRVSISPRRWSAV